MPKIYNFATPWDTPVLSPIFGLIIFAIALDSPGPVFYVSKRMGGGYRVFDFYQFRTMGQGAEQMREQPKACNRCFSPERRIDQPDDPFFFQDDLRVTE